MSDNNFITVRGRVGTDPSIHVTAAGARVVNFRLGSTRSFVDPVTGLWRDRPTEWFTVKMWGAAVENVCNSLRRGVPVIVQGELTSEEWTAEDGRRHTNVITAKVIGVEIRYGEARYTKVTREEPATGAEGQTDGNGAARAEDEAAAQRPGPGEGDEDAEEYLAPEPVDPSAWEKVG